MKPVIGITSSHDDKNKILTVPDGYYKAVYRAGGLPFILSYDDTKDTIDDYFNELDGLLLTGGVDIDPMYYHEEPVPELGTVCPIRDGFEIELAKYFIIHQKPVFGICRGIQVINVAMGGSLYQDIQSERNGKSLKHQQDCPSEYASHNVRIKEGSLIQKIMNGNLQIRVNSSHHQSVKQIGTGLTVSANASDGVIEAVEGIENDMVFGVQWHPENMFQSNELMYQLFDYFVRMCKSGK